MRVLIITDHPALYERTREIAERELPGRVDYRASTPDSFLPAIELGERLTDTYRVIFSVHCRRIFPPELVRSALCVNLHPGYNPVNRGWFPHVFSMAKGEPVGATLHVMDERVDHGPIIARERVEVVPWETSGEVYGRILDAEVRLFAENFRRVVAGDFETFEPGEGSYNSKSDFERLRRLDPDATTTVGGAIDLLRALTHGEHRNAYFVDGKTGRKVFVRVTLEPEA